jgi:hypothetical protein
MRLTQPPFAPAESIALLAPGPLYGQEQIAEVRIGRICSVSVVALQSSLIEQGNDQRSGATQPDPSQ